MAGLIFVIALCVVGLPSEVFSTAISTNTFDHQSVVEVKEDHYNRVESSEGSDIITLASSNITQASSNNIAPKKSLPIIITRFANIFGPGQMNFSALIPDCIQSSLKYSTFEPRGNGKDTRDFLFVEDVAEIYEILARELSLNKKLSGHIFNAGTNEKFKVKDIIKNIYLKNRNKKDLNKILSILPNKKTEGEIKNQLMNYDKLYKFFKWTPKTPFNKGLEKTINWYKKFLKDDSNNSITS